MKTNGTRMGMLALALTMAVGMNSVPAFAKEHGASGGGMPGGFGKGEKKGWEGDKPPGWSHGEKRGWGDAGMPPGLAKKSGHPHKHEHKHEKNEGKKDEGEKG